MDELRGKSVLITGASRGIGAATAWEFSRHGARVMLAARTAHDIGVLADAIAETGGRAESIACDVSDYPAVEAAVERCNSSFGGLDILVNNAGMIEPIAPLAEGDPQAWGEGFAVNALGVYHGLRAALPGMMAQGAGVVINISSGAATNALEGWSQYCAGKAAALMLTRAAQAECGERGVRVAGLSPGTVATDMQRAIKASGVNPVSELDWEDHIPPEWPARAIAWLCTEAAADIAGVDFPLRPEENRRRVGLID